jgi:hypothetical protein
LKTPLARSGRRRRWDADGVKKRELSPLYDAYDRYIRDRSRDRRAQQSNRKRHPGARGPAITLLWPGGTITTGATWEEIEDQERGGWNPSDPAEYRQVMKRRAKLWSGKNLPITATTTPQALFEMLADARCLVVAPSQPEGEGAIRRLRDREWATPYAGIHVFRGDTDFWKIYSEAGHYGHRGIRSVKDASRWAKIFTLPQYQLPLPAPPWLASMATEMTERGVPTRVTAWP